MVGWDPDLCVVVGNWEPSLNKIALYFVLSCTVRLRAVSRRLVMSYIPQNTASLVVRVQMRDKQPC